ncbi:MAG TPA: 4'-phosphopantetheinyl transferase superfamily protein [Streptosporangiaceae bacterium]
MKWLARGEPQLPRDISWLSPAEAQRAAEMRFTKRRTEFLVARWTAKRAIAGLMGQDIDPTRVEVRHHVTGAPEAWLDGSPLDVGISLSDRAGWAVCLLGGAPGAVGCDLELVEPRSPGFVRDYFTPAEQRRIGADELAANLFWSAKESVLKVLRTGLRRDTRTVEIALGTSVGTPAADGGGEWAPLTARTVEGAVFPGWWCRFGDFVLTVAARGPAPRPPGTLEHPPALAAATPLHSWLTEPRRTRLTGPATGEPPPCRGPMRR